ncbi:Rossmann-like domain-containing protein [Saccharopolyspora sp. MS10]|uniref:Rossmann-like domain-containing protein n=1 Tax=Saccharopolyspora sp. MS10 TaxID=3385973 RepID=UPI0039A3A7EE
MIAAALSGELTGEDPALRSVAVAFLTVQAARHPGRGTGYTNAVLSVRVGAAVGSCAVEPGAVDEETARDCAGRRVAELLRHPLPPVRVAALDAFLAAARPHAEHPLARRVVVPAGDSLVKSMARARAVAAITRVPEGGRVAVIGVVNSLLAALRERGLDYLPCDLKGGRTEWGEPVLTEHAEAIAGADAVLASGMVLGNGTFDEIAATCARRGLPLTMFAQTGPAVLRELLGGPVQALSAEPYPFFWLSGEPTPIHTYEAARPEVTS